jgi:hypothetical protein
LWWSSWAVGGLGGLFSRVVTLVFDAGEDVLLSGGYTEGGTGGVVVDSATFGAGLGVVVWDWVDAKGNGTCSRAQ